MVNNISSDIHQFVQYLQSTIKLNELEIITDHLDEELKDSQKLLNEMKNIFKSLSTDQGSHDSSINCSQQDITNFLQSNIPKLLPHDMEDDLEILNLDIDKLITAMTQYVEELRKTLVPQTCALSSNGNCLENCEFDQNIVSIEELCKRVANIRLKKTKMSNYERNEELEFKIAQLYQDVEYLTKMVEVKTNCCQYEKNCTVPSLNNKTLQYDSLINKLVQNINEVKYLLASNN